MADHFEQRAEDLWLINKLNTVVNQGKQLRFILNILAKETKRIFNSHGISLYLLSPDKKKLILHRTDDIVQRFAKIQKKIGIKIPKEAAIDLKKSNFYKQIIKKRKPRVITQANTIKKMMGEFTHDRKITSRISKIFSLMKIKSVISIPLIARNEVIGIMDISRSESFNQLEVLRITRISKQLTSILQHWQTLQQLKESEEKYKHIAENSMDAIVMVQDDRIIYVNDAAAKISGYKKAELIGNNILMVIAPEDRQLIARRSKQRLSGKKVIPRYSFTGLKKDGSRSTIELSTSTAFMYKGKPTILAVLRDITPDIESKQALKSSEAKLNSILTSMHDMVFVFNKKKQFIYYHTLYSSKLYLPPEKFLGKNITKVMPADICRLFNRAFIKNQKGKTDEFEYQLEMEGNYFCFFATMSPLMIDKKFSGSVAVVRDITENKKVQEALRQSEERFRGFMESATEGFVLFDSELNFITANDFILKAFRQKKENYLGVNLVDISFRSWEAGRFNEYMKVIKTGKSFTVEDIVVPSPIGDKHLNIKAFKVGDGLGMVVRDITDFVRIEHALRESEERYRAIVEEQTDMICCFSLDRVLTYVNNAYCTFFNKKKEELIGMNFMQLIHEKDRSYVDKKIKELNKENPVGILEERVITQDGKIRWLQWINRALLDEGGEIIEYQSVGRDITSLKKPEKKSRNK